MSTLPRILLVEDDPADTRLALAVLGDLRLTDQVMAVTDGAEAWDFLQAQGGFENRPPGNPAVIVLDLKLPRVDGLELLARVKHETAFRLIPTIILTSSREERDLRRAYELGANGYVVKVIDFEEYGAVLKTTVRYWADTNEAPPGCLPRTKPFPPDFPRSSPC